MDKTDDDMIVVKEYSESKIGFAIKVDSIPYIIEHLQKVHNEYLEKNSKS